MSENTYPSEAYDDSVAVGFGKGDESSEREVDTREEMSYIDSKEDMFVDASEELNFETPSKEAVATADDDDNGGLGDDNENKIEGFAMEIAGLQEQLKLLTGEKNSLGQDGSIVAGSSSHEVVSQFSKFLETAKEEQVQHENTVRELWGMINRKDHEIEDLTARIYELSLSHNVASSSLNSVAEGHRAQLEANNQIGVVADRILVSLSTVFGQDEFRDGSFSEKLTYVENCVSLLTAKYNEFFYGIDQLRKCFSRDGYDFGMQEDYGSILGGACSEILELKQKEAVLFEKNSYLEDENRKLTEQVNKNRETIESLNTEFGKTKAELEQERTRYANTKEKLSMAVTKGKALVQQRDALKQSVSEKTQELEKSLIDLQEKGNNLEASELVKGQLEQSLADKTNELEKCLSELHDKSLALGELDQSLTEKTKELEECLMKLQEMSSALDASELSKGELAKNEALIASYQEMLSERSSIIENFEAILSEIDAPEEDQFVDIVEKVRWLAKEMKGLRDTYNRLKDAISSMDLPEEISQSDLEECFNWLKESFFQAKGEVSVLQPQIERLSSSLSAEIQGKDSIQKDLDDMALRLKEVEANAHHMSLEKDQIVRRLVDTSGLVEEGGKGDHRSSSAMDILVDRSFSKIEEQIRFATENYAADSELIERMRSLFYVKDLDLSLCEKILGEEMLLRSQDLASVSEEKSALEKNFERLEEKSALLKEKLSMAIKKGKGLFQDRENLKHQLDEKNSEIEKLKLELQQLGGSVDDYKSKIDAFSRNLERIPELEAELMAVKEERNQLEQSLYQSNNMLEKAMKSVDNVTIPVDFAFEDPIEKINWLAGFFKEGQLAKTEAQEELVKVKDEASALASRLEETCTALKSVENALSIAGENNNRLSKENRQVQEAKESVDLELQKAVDDASSIARKLDEALATRESLEDSLMQAERSISEITNEKEKTQTGKAVAEMELEKVREEGLIQSNKLTEAYGTIKSLENALSEAENNIELLSRQIDNDKVVRINLEDELKRLKDETESLSTKMSDASMTIKFLEEALMKAEDSISTLQGERLQAEVEISTLSSKLNACMEELTGLSGNSQSRSSEIIGYLDNLIMLLKDDGPTSRVNQYLESKFKNLRDVELIVKDISKHFNEKGLLAKEVNNVTEDDSMVATPLLNGLDDFVNIGLEDIQGSMADEAQISSCLRKITEGLKLRNKILENNLESFSTSIDMLVATVLENLRAAREVVVNMFGHVESLKESMKSLEIINQEQKKTNSTLQDNVSTLLSACDEAVKELQLEVKNNLQELGKSPLPLVQGDEIGLENKSIEQLQGLEVNDKCVQKVKALSSATANACNIVKWFNATSNAAAAVIQDKENKLKEASIVLEQVVEERDLNQDKVSSLEANVEHLETSCRDLKLQLQEFKAKEENWLEKDVELLKLQDKLLAKDKEMKDFLISSSDIRALFSKINGIEIPSAEPLKGLDPHNPYDVKKLFYVVDCVTEMQHQIDLLSYEKEELQSTISTKALEMQNLKEMAETKNTAKPELEKLRTELSELTSGLERLLSILVGNDSPGDLKAAKSWALLQALDKQVTSLLMEFKGSKSKAQELGLKLASCEKLVDELSLKNKALEDKLESRTVQPDIVQERSFKSPKAPSTLEISEVEDVGLLGKNSISPVQSATQVRTIRKGSTDQLAITIDSESERLMNLEETDEDKGHVFKSLNVSGLIPKQGKTIADRIDGIWVSGGRALMSHPRARLGLIAYSLLLHLWLLVSIF